MQKLVAKIYLFLSTKIIYADPAEMEKHFYKKIYIITLCNFWHRVYTWPNTQHIQKLATKSLYILRYCRSRFFTFLCFMQKLSGTSSGKNNKSCGIFYHKSNEIKFSFLWFFYDFLHNLQKSAKALILFQLQLCSRALEKKYPFAMWSLGARPARLRPNSGEGRRRGWPGTCAGWCWGG
jgi:hypothetical protein